MLFVSYEGNWPFFVFNQSARLGKALPIFDIISDHIRLWCTTTVWNHFQNWSVNQCSPIVSLHVDPNTVHSFFFKCT